MHTHLRGIHVEICNIYAAESCVWFGRCQEWIARFGPWLASRDVPSETDEFTEKSTFLFSTLAHKYTLVISINSKAEIGSLFNFMES